MKPILTSFILAIFLTIGSINPSTAQTPEQLYQKGLTKEEGEGVLQDAINFYNQIADNPKADKSLQAKALLHIGMCYEKLGMQEAIKAYQRLVANFPAQKNEVAYARERLTKLVTITEEVAEIPLTPKFTKIKIPTKLSRQLALSPDGKRLLLVSDEKLWIMPLSGSLGSEVPGKPELLNTDGIKVEWAGLTWSGNGKSIAFHEHNSPSLQDKPDEGKKNKSIYIIPAEGGKPKKIVDNYSIGLANNYIISLSPEGKKLAFSTIEIEGEKQHIYTISTDGGTPNLLVDTLAREPVFSPDGKMIAYVEDKKLGAFGGGLWIIPASGGTPTFVAQAVNAGSSVWSPDASKIAFLDYNESKKIFIIPVGKDGKPAGEKITINAPEGITEIWQLTGWSPDNKIGVTINKVEYSLYTLPEQGGQAALVFRGDVSQPRWSPDGKQILFMKRTETKGDWPYDKLAIMPADGGKETNIMSSYDNKIGIIGFQTGMNVSSDGKQIVISAKNYDEGVIINNWPACQIWTTSIKGENLVQITKPPEPYTDFSPCWSPDGKSIAFVRSKLLKDPKVYGETSIYTINPSGGEPKLLTTEPDVICSIKWSPDGKYIAYLNNNGLNIIEAQNGISRIVGKVPRWTVHTELAWSPDSKRIAFNDIGGKVIKVMSIESDSVQDIETGLIDINIFHLDWSPDGKRFVFIGYQGGLPEFWFLENFLPLEKLAQKNEVKDMLVRKEDKEFKIRQVWADYELYSEGAPSPDGRYISYVHWDTGDLGILEIATGEKHRLTNKGTWDESDEFAEYSRWSPDGKQIVYDWYNEKGFIEFRIIGLDGSKPRILYRNEEVTWARTYGWSPDGKQILACFSIKDGAEQIVLVSVNDGSARVLKIIERGWPKNMNFSPDGRYIVYDFPQKDNSPGRDISLLSTDGSREIMLVEHPANDYVLGWAPNGENILFASDRTGTLSAWLIPVADGKPLGTPKLVKPDIGQFSTMGFTRDGSFYYNFGGEFTRDVYFAKLDQETGEILIQPKKAIKSFEGNNLSPDYSPDGKYLAYIRRIRGDVLCIHSLETGEEREFSLKLKQIELPRWSPDCSSILVAGKDDNNRWRLYQINTQTGDITPFAPPQEDMRIVGQHEWSPDGKAIFYGRQSKTDNLTQIMLREIESGTEKELYLGSSNNPFYLSCSPDGKWLAFFIKAGNELKIMPAAGGEPRELFRCKQGDHLSTLRWTPDGKYILFVIRPLGNSIRQPEQNKCSLWRIPIEGGEPEKLGLEMNYTEHMSVHPDGQHIAFYNISARIGEVWMMENFLPKE